MNRRYSSALRDGPSLKFWPLVGFLFIFLSVYVPVCYWAGWNNPALFDLRGHGYPQDWAEMLALVAALGLCLVPLGWIALGRAIDVLALQLLLSGMILIGYFVLDLTAPVIFGAEKKILSGGEQAVAINAIGFFTLLFSLVGCYLFFSLRRARLPSMRDSPQETDRRMRVFLLVALVVAIGMIALPMLLTGVIPMLSADPMIGRGILEQSSLGRPFYNLASSLLPALVAGSVCLALRHRGIFSKLFSPGMIISAMALVVQFLTSNRLPIALTLLTFCALWSMERKRSRPLLVLGVAAFMALYLGLSGFSSIIRQSRDMLGDRNIVAASFREAFLGNNLSDLRDGAWVFGAWNYVPLNGKTYLGAVGALLPSAVFPEKKDSYLGLVALRIVNWPVDGHFGLRISFFAESFLNFGLAGVVGLGVLIGCLGGYLLKKLHLSVAEPAPCLTRNLRILLSMQLVLVLSESSQGFVFYSILMLLFAMWLFVLCPLRFNRRAEPSAIPRLA